MSQTFANFQSRMTVSSEISSDEGESRGARVDGAEPGTALDAAGGVLAFSSRHPIDEDDIGDDEDLYIAAIQRPAVPRQRLP